MGNRNLVFNTIPDTQQEISNLMRTKLNNINAKKILEMKEKREREGVTKHALSSIDIYKKVLV